MCVTTGGSLQSTQESRLTTYDKRNIEFSAGYVPTLKMFDDNMAMKLAMPEFLDDTDNYLRSGMTFDAWACWEDVRARLFEVEG